LRLINGEDGSTPLGILLEKKQVEGIQEARSIGGTGWDTEFPIDALKKFGWRKTRIEDQGRTVTICVKLAEECAQDRRLP
jgi:hypothetical protein